MKQILYSTQFKGTAAPEEGSSNVLKAATKAPSCNISTVVGPQGVTGSIEEAAGDEASFESVVTITGETSFQETGSVTFGEGGHGFTFDTVGEGYLGKSPEEGVLHGSVIWRIEKGQGQFEGAAGFITSNFTVGAQGEVTDNHFGVIYTQE